VAPVGRQTAEEPFDLVAFEKPGFGRCGALHGYRGDPLADSEGLRRAGSDVLEERVDGCKALISGPDVVVPIDLEVTQEPRDPLEAQIVEPQPCDSTALVGG
jgi:hypothetical protein